MRSLGGFDAILIQISGLELVHRIKMFFDTNILTLLAYLFFHHIMRYILLKYPHLELFCCSSPQKLVRLLKQFLKSN